MKQVRAYDEGGKLLSVYPATIGSSTRPRPRGRTRSSGSRSIRNTPTIPSSTSSRATTTRFSVSRPARTAGGFRLDRADKPTYGIHGTPEPSKIGKTESHGCVRLTNWDAQDLGQAGFEGRLRQFLD